MYSTSDYGDAWLRIFAYVFHKFFTAHITELINRLLHNSASASSYRRRTLYYTKQRYCLSVDDQARAHLPHLLKCYVPIPT